MSDNAPTMRLPTTPPPAPPPRRRPTPPKRPSRGPMIAFIVLSVVLVAAVVVLVYVLVNRSAAASAPAMNPPSTTASSAAPAAQPPPPPPPAGVFTAFTVPTSQQCRGHGNGRQPVDAQVTWATTNATQVWFAQGTTDAASAGFERVPLSGNQDSFPTPVPIDCDSRSMTFTMTLVGADGAHVSRTWTVMVASHRG
jgi:hypothetical protein